MASASPLKALMALYRTLDADNFPDETRPEIYLGAAVDTEGNTEVRIPYVILKDGKANPTWHPASGGAVYRHPVSLEFWYEDLDDAEAAVTAAMWNGEASIEKAGIALARLDLLLPLKTAPVAVWPGGPARRLAGRNVNNQFVHSMAMDFVLQYYRVPGTPVL